MIYELNVSEILVILGKKAELFHDPHQMAYASLGGATYPVASHDFRLWLRGEFYHLQHYGPPKQAVHDAVGMLEAIALFDSPEFPVFVRLAEIGCKIYLDLADGGKAVEITPGGWFVVDNSPVKFLRRRGMLPLPIHEHGGDISSLAGILESPG